MIGEHPIKQILLNTQAYWDHEGTPAHVRENFLNLAKDTKKKAVCSETLHRRAEVLRTECEGMQEMHSLDLELSIEEGLDRLFRHLGSDDSVGTKRWQQKPAARRYPPFRHVVYSMASACS